MNFPKIDFTRLVKLKPKLNGDFRAQCPACAANGMDRKGNHLLLFANGNFGCAVFKGDREHRKLILNLAGFGSPERCLFRTESAIGWARFNKGRNTIAADRVLHSLRGALPGILSTFDWSMEDAMEESPIGVTDSVKSQSSRLFLESLFESNSLIWTGKVFETSKDGRFRSHWRTCRQWLEAPISTRIGPHLSRCIWRPGTVSRSADNVVCDPYIVMDFDGLDGVKPISPNEINAHKRASLALVRWFREKHRLKLAAILDTGNKGIHAWFHSPTKAKIRWIFETAKILGLDANLLIQPEHPCRLPGQLHEKSGKLSKVLWLQQLPERRK